MADERKSLCSINKMPLSLIIQISSNMSNSITIRDGPKPVRDAPLDFKGVGRKFFHKKKLYPHMAQKKTLYPHMEEKEKT